MSIWYNYIVISPLKEQYDDDGSRDLFSIPVNIDGVGRFVASGVGSPNEIELIRITTIDSDGNLTHKQIESVQLIKAHVFAVLRATYNASINEFRVDQTFLSLGCKDVAGKPDFHVKIELRANRDKVNGTNIVNVFVATENIRHILILLGEAQDGGIPFHYRYLSIYKAFEAEFKPTGKWIELDDVFSEIKEQYEAKRAVKRSLVNHFHELRDRRAHVLKGGKLGLLGLPDRDGQDVELLLPLLVAALAEHVNRKYPAIRFALREASIGRI
jgi:hypothetical protein